MTQAEYCDLTKKYKSNLLIFQKFVDEDRQECYDETVTEMVTETVMEEQCTGKVISVFGIKKFLSYHMYLH